MYGINGSVCLNIYVEICFFGTLSHFTVYHHCMLLLIQGHNTQLLVWCTRVLCCDWLLVCHMTIHLFKELQA